MEPFLRSYTYKNEAIYASQLFGWQKSIGERICLSRLFFSFMCEGNHHKRRGQKGGKANWVKLSKKRYFQAFVPIIHRTDGLRSTGKEPAPQVFLMLQLYEYLLIQSTARRGVGEGSRVECFSYQLKRRKQRFSESNMQIFLEKGFFPFPRGNGESFRWKTFAIVNIT